MAKSKSSEVPPRDYLSGVDLDLTEQDLKNSGVVKKILQEHKELLVENAGLKESLESTQDVHAALEAKYHKLDKDHAVLKKEMLLLKVEKKSRQGLTIFQDVALAGMGVGGGLLFNSLALGAVVLVPCLAVYGIARYHNR